MDIKAYAEDQGLSFSLGTADGDGPMSVKVSKDGRDMTAPVTLGKDSAFSGPAFLAAMRGGFRQLELSEGAQVRGATARSREEASATVGSLPEAARAQFVAVRDAFRDLVGRPAYATLLDDVEDPASSAST